MLGGHSTGRLRKKISVMIFISLLLLSSISLNAGLDINEPNAGRKNVIGRKDDLGKINLFGHEMADDSRGSVSIKSAGDPPFQYSPVANWRQVYNDDYTLQDRQHHTSPGRQIVYAGYYNAGCDYVYMDYAYRAQIGATVLQYIKFAVFDWTNHTWDWTMGGSEIVSPPTSCFDPNIDATLDNASSVVSYIFGPGNQTWFSNIGYSDLCAPAVDYDHTIDSLPGSPNLDGLVTGYCDDNQGDQSVSPYIWPIIDVDTISDGRVITHVAYKEWGECDDLPADEIDVGTLVYSRKISDTGMPFSGIWDGPYFIDSVYNIAHIVRADKNPGQKEVYFAYLKPMYYKYGSPHPCTGGGQYQITSDVVYRVSNDDGAAYSWSAPIYITDYGSGFEDGLTEPAVYEISAMVDPTGCFHVVWLSANRDPDDFCGALLGCKLWHWDNCNACISIAYDASHPAYIPYDTDIGSWNWMVAKPNISWCDDKLYILFTRFGTHTDPLDPDLATDIAHNGFLNGDLMVVASDAMGGMGVTWTAGFNLTDTGSDSCLAGDCQSEHWPTMAMYSTDSLMIEYILDLEAGAKGGSDEEDECVWTDNPVIFMTWPCFSMADMGTNVQYALSRDPATWSDIYLAPNGNTAACSTPEFFSDVLKIMNTGNVNLMYTTSSDSPWLTVIQGASGMIYPGSGPLGSDDPFWNGAMGCAASAEILWMASSASLNEGEYTGTISVGFSDPWAEDFDIVVDVVVCCYEKKEWTIMVYLNADNDLEQAGIDDFNEMEQVGSTDKAHVVVQMDRISKAQLKQHYLDEGYSDSIAEAWAADEDDTGNGNWDDTRRYYITKDNFPDSITSVVLDSLTVELNMGDGDTLVDFVNFCIDNFPADHHALILWNHGSGWHKKDGSCRERDDPPAPFKGIGWDYTNDDDYLEISSGELGDALDEIKTHLGRKIDLIGFDACFMQMWEVMDMTANYVDYQVGSEETEKNDGWDYAGFLTDLNNPVSATPSLLGKYMAANTVANSPQYTMSCVDLSHIVALTTSLDALTLEFLIAILDPFNGEAYIDKINEIRSSLKESRHEFDDESFIDLYDLADKISSEPTFPQTLIIEANNIKSGIEGAVDTNVTMAGHTWAHGISIYYPHQILDDYNAMYDDLDIAAATGWDDHIKVSPSHSAAWAFISKLNGVLGVYGMQNDSMLDPPLFDVDNINKDQTYSGDFSGESNNLMFVFAYSAQAMEFTKVAIPYYRLGEWHLWPVNLFVEYKTFPGDSILLPNIGDSSETIEEIHIAINVGQWLANPKPFKDSYVITNGACADLPGYLLGTTAIDYDEDADSTANPFSTTRLNGTVYLDGKIILKIGDEDEYTGRCGDANGDGTVNVSDAVRIINYVFVGGEAPVPLACGDANDDGTVNVSDAVRIINYVFVGGEVPGDCSPGSANWTDGNCGPFE